MHEVEQLHVTLVVSIFRHHGENFGPEESLPATDRDFIAWFDIFSLSISTRVTVFDG